MTEASPRALADRIAALCADRGPIRIMEVCGTHTVSMYRHGIRSMLPPNLRLLSGPGCPVCVSSQGYIDAACAIAGRDKVMVCTYGDMMSVPGSGGSLQQQRAAGADVRVVYSPLEAVRQADHHPERDVVFVAVGFETTVPGHAAAVLEARRRKLPNFYLLTAQKQVVPAMMALLEAGDVRIDGFLCPGHVSVIVGSKAYAPVVERHGKPCVVAGFEPGQIVLGLLRLVEQIAAGRAELDNVYQVAVHEEGNASARGCMEEVFEPASTVWRAMGPIPQSGLELRTAYRRFDALGRFNTEIGPDHDPPGCRCGEVIQGKAEPKECLLFGTRCTPSEPVGPCMVSSEGTCAAAYKYDRVDTSPATSSADGAGR